MMKFIKHIILAKELDLIVNKHIKLLKCHKMMNKICKVDYVKLKKVFTINSPYEVLIQS